MRKIFFVLLVSMFFLISCDTSDSKIDGADDLYYYIMAYKKPTSMTTDQRSSGFYLDLSCDWIYWGSSEEFLSLAERYGDTTYYSYGVPFSQTALAGDLEYVNVTCDSDYDENHSAGELLNDIMGAEFFYYYPYVSSGYDDSVERVSCFDGYLNEIDPSVHRLVSTSQGVIIVKFMSLPTDLDAEYTFNIELRCDDYIVNTSSVLLGSDIASIVEYNVAE